MQSTQENSSSETRYRLEKEARETASFDEQLQEGPEKVSRLIILILESSFFV